MAQSYDPVPDVAAVLAGMYRVEAHGIPGDVSKVFGRLMDKLRPGVLVPDAATVEVKLREAISRMPVSELAGKDGSDGG